MLVHWPTGFTSFRSDVLSYDKSYMVLLQAMTVGKGSRSRSTPLHADAHTARQPPVASVKAGMLRGRAASVASAATRMPVRYTRCSTREATV